MNSIRIFIDFGSTFTKMTAFDVEGEQLLARIQVPSTVDSDITDGLELAFAELAQTVPVGWQEKRQAVACSSAAGGLRIVCVGLVPEYTTLAGRMAALGAGAKIVGEYSYDLSDTECREIEQIAPDIVLLTGGTDGGNKKVILHNGRMLAACDGHVKNIIVAGNKSAYDELKTIFTGSGKQLVFTKNVMPDIGVIDVDFTNAAIRELFINHITVAKGITRVRRIINDVVRPTPSAVLEAVKILADGNDQETGLGELALVDVGGATTDIYSAAHGASGKKVVTIIGLPEPYLKRTVEGDLGLVHNLDVLQEIANREQLPDHFNGSVSALGRAGTVPQGPQEAEAHFILSRLAVKTAMERHAGTIKTVHTLHGDMFVQKGKNLTDIQYVIGSGGAVSFSHDPLFVLKGVLFQPDNPAALLPIAPRMLLDKHNIMYAIGLLSLDEPLKALRIGKKYLSAL